MKRHKFNENIEAVLVKNVISEKDTSARNESQELEDFNAVVDMFDLIRAEKNYDWNSDISLPEFSTRILTQDAMDVSQYFTTRDFVEVYLQDESPEAMNAAEANKELINRTLNRKKLYYFQKYIRAKNINYFRGNVVAKCWWDQSIISVPKVGEDGQPVMDENQTVVMEDRIKRDNFDFDIVSPGNVFLSPEYRYSLQDKNYVIIRHDDMTLEKMKNQRDSYAYFNLDVIEESLKPAEKTETQKAVEREPKEIPKTIIEPFDIYERYGKYWVVEDDKGLKPGIGTDGKPLKDARLEEMVIGILSNAGTNILVQFHKQPYIDCNGEPYRPLIRGICYVHPTNDGGVGDGKYAKELQIAIDDTFNVSADRTMMATLPMMQAPDETYRDNDTLYFQPGHVMKTAPNEQIREFKITDDINGSVMLLNMLFNKYDQTMAIFPTTMGGTPQYSSTTATAVSGAEMRVGQRTNYKSMTFEHTFLTDLYWMITQMTDQFARPETGEKLMGKKVVNFKPELEYFYKPLSQSIESTESKNAKIQQLTTLFSYVMQSQNPNAPKLANYFIMRIAELMGDEFVNLVGAFFDEKAPLQLPPGGGANPEGTGAISPNAPSNQSGIPMGNAQAMNREVMSGGMQ